MHMALFFCFQRVILSTENVQTQSTFPMILSPQPAALHGCRAHDHEDLEDKAECPGPDHSFWKNTRSSWPLPVALIAPLGGVKAIHLEYLSELANAAWADCRISESERREIQLAAQLLGFGRLSDDSTTYCAPARATSVPMQL